MRTVRTRNNGTRFIEQYEWTIGVCITVQIGECGIFTDVQISERGKQRVKQVKLKHQSKNEPWFYISKIVKKKNRLYNLY